MDAKHMHTMCLRKRAYKTRKYAIKKAEEFSKYFNVKYYVYYCPLCFNYHLTTHKHEGAKYENCEDV